MAGRLEFTDLVDQGRGGRALFLISISGVIIAVIVQPTIGSISDYTISRWGRRKPYIFIGSLLDVVFLVGIASSNTLSRSRRSSRSSSSARTSPRGRSRATSRTSSRRRRSGPPARLVGLMQVLGDVVGLRHRRLATATHNYESG